MILVLGFFPASGEILATPYIVRKKFNRDGAGVYTSKDAPIHVQRD